jgi:hypothetical protein
MEGKLKYNVPYGKADEVTWGDTPYVNGNPSTGTAGSIPPAASIEYPQREIVNLIKDAGIVASNSDLQQLARAVQSGMLMYGVDTGSANTYSVNLTPALAQYYDGLSVWVIPANSNTGPSTININGVGIRSIVHRGGGALVAGDMPGSYKSLLVYNTSHANFELYGIGVGFDPTQIATVAPICVGFSLRVSASLTAASTSVVFTAAEIAVATPVTTGQTGTMLSNFNRTLNVATVGAGGMDIGAAPASSFVYIYAIYNPATLTSSILATLSSASTTVIYSGTHMPAGYTMSCLIAVWPTNASGQLLAGQLVDRLWTYGASPQVLNNGTATSPTAINLVNTVPVVARSATVQFAGNEQVSVTATSQANLYNVSTGASQLIVSASALGGTIWVNGEIALATAQTLYYAAGKTSVLTALVLLGYRI